MTSTERRAVTSLALLYSFRMLGLFMVLPLLALYAADLDGASPALIGLALGIYGLSQAVLQIPYGWLSDHIGRKPVIIGGLVIFALGSLVAGLSESIYGVIAGRALQGAGAIAGTLMAMVADLTRDEQRTKAMAIVGASIGLAFAVALVLGPLIAAWGGLSAVFFVTVVLALIGVGIVLGPVPTPRTQAQESSAPQGRLVGRVLRDPQLMRLDGGVFVLHFTLTASFLVIPGLLESVLGLSRDEHWWVYLVVVLASLLVVFPLMRRAEGRGLVRQSFAAAIVVLVVALALLALLELPAVVWVALFLFFIGFNYLEATLPSLVSKAVFPGGRGTALGIYSTCQFLGAFAGGAAGGWLIEAASGTALLMLAAGLMVLWLVLALPRPAPASQSATSA